MKKGHFGVCLFFFFSGEGKICDFNTCFFSFLRHVCKDFLVLMWQKNLRGEKTFFHISYNFLKLSNTILHQERKNTQDGFFCACVCVTIPLRQKISLLSYLLFL